MGLPSHILPRPSLFASAEAEPAGRGTQLLLKVRRYLLSAAVLTAEGAIFLMMKSLQAYGSSC
jgi:hypothetical protein